MPRKADQTDAQKVTAENDKFRREAYANALEEAEAAPTNDDIDQFRKDTYRQALKDARHPNITT